MGKAYNDHSFTGIVHQYLVTGRKLQQAGENHPEEIYSMRIFAKNAVFAKSQFWAILKKQNKIKRANGEILSVNEIFEKNNRTVRTYGIVLRYQSRTGIHNIYREIRDVSLNGAISQLYTIMSGNHRCNLKSIKIIKTHVLQKSSEYRREANKQLRNSKISFPIGRSRRAPLKKYRSLFKAYNSYKA